MTSQPYFMLVPFLGFTLQGFSLCNSEVFLSETFTLLPFHHVAQHSSSTPKKLSFSSHELEK
jgi:hypothetical protein